MYVTEVHTLSHFKFYQIKVLKNVLDIWILWYMWVREVRHVGTGEGQRSILSPTPSAPLGAWARGAGNSCRGDGKAHTAAEGCVCIGAPSRAAEPPRTAACSNKGAACRGSEEQALATHNRHTCLWTHVNIAINTGCLYLHCLSCAVTDHFPGIFN